MSSASAPDLRLAEHPFGFVLVSVFTMDGLRRVMVRCKSYKAAMAKLNWYDKHQAGRHNVTMHPIPEGMIVELRMEWPSA